MALEIAEYFRDVRSRHIFDKFPSQNLKEFFRYFEQKLMPKEKMS